MSEWELKPGTLWRRCLDGALVLAPDSDEILELSESATAIWERLAEGRAPTPTIVACLLETYAGDEALVTSQVHAALTVLEDGGVIRSGG